MVYAKHIFKDRSVCLYLMLFIPLSYIVPLVTVEFCMTCAVSPVGREGKANRDGKLSQCFLMLMDSAKVSAINLLLCCISFRCRHRTRVIWMQMSQQTDTCTHTVHLVKQRSIKMTLFAKKKCHWNKDWKLTMWQLLLLSERKGLEIHPYYLRAQKCLHSSSEEIC